MIKSIIYIINIRRVSLRGRICSLVLQPTPTISLENSEEEEPNENDSYKLYSMTIS